MLSYLEWFVPAFPILGALLNACLSTKLAPRVRHVLACTSVIASLLAALPLLIGHALAPNLVGHSEPLPWYRVWSGQRFVEGPLALRVDILSATVVMIAAVLALLLHLHLASGSDHGSHPLSPALLNAMLGAVILLILADNMLCLLVAWSLIGWCVHQFAHDFPVASPACQPEQGATGNRTLAGPRLRFYLFSPFSDMCLLLAIGLMSETYPPLAFDKILAQEPLGLATQPWTRSIIVFLLLLSAMVRAAQFPFHAWIPAQGGAVVQAWLHTLACTLPSVYLIERIYPLLERTSFALPLLSWWAGSSALLLALSALVQSNLNCLIHFTALSLGGLSLLALGQGAYAAAFAFLPVCVLVQALLFLAAGTADPAGEARVRTQATPLARSAILFGLAAAAGLPLLPGFAFSGHLIATAYGKETGTFVLAALTILVLAASAARASSILSLGSSPRTARPISAVWVLVSASTILGWLNLASLPAGRLLEPLLGLPVTQPAWWWFGITTGIVAVGAALGFVSRSWSLPLPAKAVSLLTQEYEPGTWYHVVVARSLLALGRWIVRNVEIRALAWMGRRLLDWEHIEDPFDGR